MTSSSDAHSSQGPAGTARLDAATGPAGTARLDAGPAGTARIATPDAAGPAGTAGIATADAAGPGGTARIAPQAAGPAGTARVGDTAAAMAGAGGTARVGAQPLPTAQADDGGAAQHLMPGQAVTFKGRSYRVESTLSTTTSEARTYVVAEGEQRYVLKHYRPGVRAPLAALAALQAAPHANVVAIHDQGHEAGQDFEVLEYFPAGTLDQLLRRDGPLRDLDRLRRLATQIADGLQHLHDQVGLIYQDLKPENVLVSGPDLARVVLADFGISTLRQGHGDVQVTANGTREYAAPELARFGNETQTLVSEKVDYFALGITLLECWQGSRPFQGVPDGVRVAQIRECEVPFPAGMDASLETLIKGLLNPSVKQRFGLEQVRRWVADLPLQVTYARTQRVYERLAFRGDEAYETPAQLAALLEKYPELGLDYLYVGTVGKWLEAARDMELGTQIEKIVRQFDQDDAHRRAGLMRAVYTLDVQRPFVSAGGRRCATSEELGDALLAEQDHYVAALAQPFDPFYLYLQARGEGEFAAEMLSRFMGKPGGRAAFNQLVYELHSGGRIRLKLAGREFLLPEELADAPADVQQALRDGLLEPQSRVLLWLMKLGIVEQLEALPKAKPVDQLSVTQAMPWLRLTDFVPDIDQRTDDVVMGLMRAHRHDLLEEFVRQGQSFDAPRNVWKPLVIAACWGRLDEVRFMLDHGADIEVVDKEGDSALSGAIRYRRQDVLELLLSRGASLASSLPDGQTLLGLALQPLQTEKQKYPVEPAVVARLLKAGVDANAISASDLTPLQRAIACDVPDVALQLIDLLVDAGADPNRPSQDGVLPLHMALVETPLDRVLPVVEKLLARGADPQRVGHNHLLKGGTPCNALFMALYSHHFKHKHAAAYLPVIERLLKAGVKPQLLDQGKAPLHWAALWGDEALVQLLLAHGARRHQVGDDHMLPATYARVAGAQALVPLLAPGVGLLLGGHLKQFGALLFRSLVLMLLVLPLLPTGTWFKNNLDHLAWLHPLGLGLMYGQLLLTALALRANAVGDGRAFLAVLKAALRSFKGWLNWLVMAPLALAVLGAVADAVLAQGLREFQLSQLLRTFQWPLFGAALLLCALSVVLSRRASAASAPYRKFMQAKHNRPAGAPRRGQGLASVVLAGLMLWPTYLLLDRLTNGAAPADRSAAEDGVDLAALTPLGRGSVTRPWAVRDGNGALVCTLPAGTALAEVRGTAAQPVLLARVAKAPAACGGRLTAPIKVHRDWVRLAGAEPERKAVAAEAARKPAADAAGPARLVAGTVSGLSPEGWPVIDGQALPLHGVAGIAESRRRGFEKWLAGVDNQLRCERLAPGRFRCLSLGDVDAAEALLLNGAATAAADAPAAYKDAMAQAVAAKRGQWK